MIGLRRLAAELGVWLLIGSAIVRFALEDTRARGLKVRPTCWFVRGFIERHPEYADLLEDPGTTPSTT